MMAPIKSVCFFCSRSELRIAKKQAALTVLATWIVFFLMVNLGVANATNVINLHENSSLTPQDFAMGVSLVPDEDAIQTFLLPALFYELVTPNMTDMRVFDSANTSVPFIIKAPTKKIVRERKASIPFFPIYSKNGDSLNPLEFKINSSSQSFAVTFDGEENIPENEKITAYVLDMRAVQETNIQLEFDWTTPATGVIDGLFIDESDDLRGWTRISSSQSLSRLVHNDATLERKHIRLSGADKRYLRIGWHDRQPGFVLSAISAITHEKKIPAPTDKIVQSFDLMPVEGLSNTFEMDTKTVMPVHAIELKSAQKNVFFTARLSARDTTDDDWRFVTKIEQFDLTKNGSIYKSEPVKLRGLRHRYWQLVFAQPQSMAPLARPQVFLTYMPQTLAFLAQGNPPFTLAFGNPNVITRGPSSQQVFAGMSETDWRQRTSNAIKPSRPFNLGGSGKLLATPLPLWKPALLWVVLIMGVLLMARMCWTLLSTMNDDKG